MKILLIWFSAAMVILLVGLTLNGDSLLLDKFYKPREAAIERETFEQTKAYRDGMINQLAQEKQSYDLADSAHKILLRQDIIDKYAAYAINSSDPLYLQTFLINLRNCQPFSKAQPCP